MTTAGWLELTRWTARIGLPLFLVFFVTRRNRPWLTLFALTHTVHLAALSMYLYRSDESRPALTVMVGGLGYAAIYVLAFAPVFANRSRVTRVGPLLIFAIFSSSYVGRLLENGRRAVGAYGTLLLAAAALARLHGVRRKRVHRNLARRNLVENDEIAWAEAEAITKDK